MLILTLSNSMSFCPSISLVFAVLPLKLPFPRAILTVNALPGLAQSSSILFNSYSLKLPYREYCVYHPTIHVFTAAIHHSLHPSLIKRPHPSHKSRVINTPHFFMYWHDAREESLPPNFKTPYNYERHESINNGIVFPSSVLKVPSSPNPFTQT